MDLWGDIMEKGIGKRIKEARLNLGLTQEELAEKIGVTKGAIANYEKNTSHPKEPVMYALIETLGVDANYLFQDCVKISNPSISLSEKEKAVVLAYRAHPDMQNAVDTLLNVQPQNDIADDIVDTLANGEDVFSPQNIRSE